VNAAFTTIGCPDKRLVLGPPAWHGRAMSQSNDATRAGGSLLAFSIIGGTVVGVILGQPSIGFLVGTGIGLLVLTAMWLKSRNR
jgi:hypothetical protein